MCKFHFPGFFIFEMQNFERDTARLLGIAMFHRAIVIMPFMLYAYTIMIPWNFCGVYSYDISLETRKSNDQCNTSVINVARATFRLFATWLSNIKIYGELRLYSLLKSVVMPLNSKPIRTILMRIPFTRIRILKWYQLHHLLVSSRYAMRLIKLS